ncbi:hypothetical protein V6N13_045077 [Hibiscus sabdariffa]
MEKGRALPKFGEWDVNNPATAEGFTVIFNKARNEKRAGSKIDFPVTNAPTRKQDASPGKPSPVSSCLSSPYEHVLVFGNICRFIVFDLMVLQKKWFCCVQAKDD